jgi:hypothetical protein
LIGGSEGVDTPPGSENGFVLDGEVLDDEELDGVLTGVSLSSGVALDRPVGAVASAGTDAGGGVVGGVLIGGADAFVCGETATTIGATAALCPSGLTAEPTITPNPSNAITATPASAGDRPASAPPADAAAASSATE